MEQYASTVPSSWVVEIIESQRQKKSSQADHVSCSFKDERTKYEACLELLCTENCGYFSSHFSQQKLNRHNMMQAADGLQNCMEPQGRGEKKKAPIKTRRQKWEDREPASIARQTNKKKREQVGSSTCRRTTSLSREPKDPREVRLNLSAFAAENLSTQT